MPAVASIHIQPEGQGGEATAIIHIGKNYKKLFGFYFGFS